MEGTRASPQLTVRLEQNDLCSCGSVKVTKRFCRACQDHANWLSARSHARQRLGGLCERGCGNVLASKTLCVKCLADAATRKLRVMKARVAAGICCVAGCGRPLETKWRCGECSEKKRVYQNERAARLRAEKESVVP